MIPYKKFTLLFPRLLLILEAESLGLYPDGKLSGIRPRDEGQTCDDGNICKLREDSGFGVWGLGFRV